MAGCGVALGPAVGRRRAGVRPRIRTALQLCVVGLQSGFAGSVQSLHVAAARGPAGAVGAARARAADRRRRRPRAGPVAVGVAALVVLRVADAAHADERRRGRGARAVERRVRVRRVGRDGDAVGELGRAGVRALVAPVAAVQSASTLQPPAGSHVAVVLHAPERQTVAAVGRRCRARRRWRSRSRCRACRRRRSRRRACPRRPCTCRRASGSCAAGRSGWASPLASLRRARVRALVAPVAAGAVGVDVAAAERLAEAVGAARRPSGRPAAVAPRCRARRRWRSRTCCRWCRRRRSRRRAARGRGARAVERRVRVRRIGGHARAVGDCGVQVCMLSSHQLPPAQSASTLQPPAGSQVPLALQAPERQTVAAFAVVHGPSPGVAALEVGVADAGAADGGPFAPVQGRRRWRSRSGCRRVADAAHADERAGRGACTCR